MEGPALSSPVDLKRWQRWLYRLGYYPTAGYFLLGHCLRVEGRKNVPPTGGLLVVANHQSYYDPPAIGVAVRRQLSFLARKQLFGAKSFARVIESLGAIPLDVQASALEGIKTTIAHLKTGKAVLMFPEGTRTLDGQIHEFKPGVALLIRRAGVPVLPVAIAGAYEAWPIHQRLPRPAPLFLPSEPGAIAIVIGKAIDPAALAGMKPENMLEQLRAILVGLRARAERLRRKE